MIPDPVTINLDRDVSLVLFELLCRRASDGGKLNFIDPGEEYAFDRLRDQLEAELVYRAEWDFRQQIAQALERLRERPLDE